jgi:hypothetical protein
VSVQPPHRSTECGSEFGDEDGFQLMRSKETVGS